MVLLAGIVKVCQQHGLVLSLGRLLCSPKVSTVANRLAGNVSL
jgi:hypothetical protein